MKRSSSTSVCPTNATIGDGQAVGTIFDILAGKQVQIRLEATDLAGNPLTLVEGGTPFLLKGFVDDLRPFPTASSPRISTFCSIRRWFP